MIDTTGGYPKVATVISADLPALGRMPVGSKISFEPVTVETAQALRRAMFAEIDRIPERIVPIGRSGSDMAPLRRISPPYLRYGGDCSCRELRRPM